MASTLLNAAQGKDEAPTPSALLTQPKLHLRGVSAAVTDEEIVGALEECLKVRLRIARDGRSRFEEVEGTIEFAKLHNGTEDQFFPGERVPDLDLAQLKRHTQRSTVTHSTSMNAL